MDLSDTSITFWQLIVKSVPHKDASLSDNMVYCDKLFVRLYIK